MPVIKGLYRYLETSTLSVGCNPLNSTGNRLASVKVKHSSQTLPSS